MTTAFLLRTAAAALLLLTTACARPAPPADVEAGAPSSPEPPRADLVLRVEHVGGFVTPETLVSRLPMVSVYADGKVITEGPQILIYPGPALPNVQVQQIDRAAVDTLVERAVAAGVRSGADVGEAPVADVPATRFTVVTDSGPQVLDVPALAETPADAGNLTRQQRATRNSLRDFVDRLTDLPRLLGAASVGKAQAYRPTAVAAIAVEWQPAGDPAVKAASPRPWPGPALPGAPAGRGDAAPGCVTVSGDAVRAVLAAAADANTLTPWTSGGRTWTVTFRPLLPDETDCRDLVDAS